VVGSPVLRTERTRGGRGTAPSTSGGSPDCGGSDPHVGEGSD